MSCTRQAERSFTAQEQHTTHVSTTRFLTFHVYRRLFFTEHVERPHTLYTPGVGGHNMAF